ncbi:MAG: adenylosuccinate lyase [Proteobacteria bacterium]|jgi:adenylosuccinate lyase|nr:adenylosuccinate lyase [Pseudomonadota bacterium]
MDRDVYREPLVSRYTSRAMQELFSEDTKFRTWRRCWIALAEAQRELGLTGIVSEEALAEMRAHADDIDYELAEKLERELRHDVMAHVKAYGALCPAAAGIIHLGATSQFVVCNTDLILHKRALGLIRDDLVRAIDRLAATAERYADLPVLGATHFQPAQPTTLGKRLCLGIQDLLADLDAIEWAASRVVARGVKGTTGTQDSFLKLFGGDHAKVEAIDALVSRKLGFEGSFPVTGQTYPRKLDTKIAEALAGIGASAHWIGVNVRLMSGLKEVDEPFGARQVGSSAMAYKRNPMRSERMCSLARKLMNLPADFQATHANQWMERTLDDSAIRRMDIPQAYLLADAVLGLLLDVGGGLVANPAAIRARLVAELPFLATEEILVAAVARGGNRQEAHEVIRDHAVEAARRVKEEGLPNDLLERLAADPRIPLGAEELRAIAADPARFIGRAPEQVTAFLEGSVRPRLKGYADALAGGRESRVSV